MEKFMRRIWGILLHFLKSGWHALMQKYQMQNVPFHSALPKKAFQTTQERPIPSNNFKVVLLSLWCTACPASCMSWPPLCGPHYSHSDIPFWGPQEVDWKGVWGPQCHQTFPLSLQPVPKRVASLGDWNSSSLWLSSWAISEFVLQRDLFFFFTLNFLAPRGLNEKIEINTIL